MEQPKRSGSDLKGFSCVHCRQRKVKCDQRTPCLNCTKAKRQCSFVAPVRGKRKKTKPARETLHARLRRYEEMLKGYGAKLELGEDGDDSYSEVESAKTPETNASTVSKAVSPLCRHGSEEDKPQFIMKEGASRYFDRYVPCQETPPPPPIPLDSILIHLSLVLSGPICQKM